MSSSSVAEKEHSTGIKMLLVAVLCLGLNWPGMKLGLEIVGPVWMVCALLVKPSRTRAVCTYRKKRLLKLSIVKIARWCLSLPFQLSYQWAYFHLCSLFLPHGYSYLHYTALDAAYRHSGIGNVRLPWR